MEEPKVSAETPSVLELEPGSYWWCACGLSSSQPFCDGSHAGTRFNPVQVQVDRTRTVALCQCKRTGRIPYCDGSHGSL